MAHDLTLFYVFAAVAVVTSLLVVSQSNPVYSVLLLIGSFLALAGLYVLLAAPFVAVIQIIVYAGAIMVLFLFVVMLLNAPKEDAAQADIIESGATRAFGALLAIVFVAELVWAVSRSGAMSTPAPAEPARNGMVRERDRADSVHRVRICVRGDVGADSRGHGGRDRAGRLTAPATES